MAKTITVRKAESSESNAAPVKLSGVNAIMSITSEYIASAVEQGHEALAALEISAAKWRTAVEEARSQQADLLVDMLTHIVTCLKARAAGAKALKNSVIDETLIKAGVKEVTTAKVQNGKFTLGSKSGASRFIALATFQEETLWTEANAAALRHIRDVMKGIALPQGRYATPFDAIRAGAAYSTVHGAWAKMVKALNDQVAPPATVTKFDRVSKMAQGLTAPERQALATLLAQSVESVGKTVPTNQG